MNNYLKKIAELIRTFRSNSRDKVKDIFDFLNIKWVEPEDRETAENFKVWRQNGDPWFDLESNNAEDAKVWNAKGELIDDESSEIIIERNNFKKLLDELMKD